MQEPDCRWRQLPVQVNRQFNFLAFAKRSFCPGLNIAISPWLSGTDQGRRLGRAEHFWPPRYASRAMTRTGPIYENGRLAQRLFHRPRDRIHFLNSSDLSLFLSDYFCPDVWCPPSFAPFWLFRIVTFEGRAERLI